MVTSAEPIMVRQSAQRVSEQPRELDPRHHALTRGPLGCRKARFVAQRPLVSRRMLAEMPLTALSSSSHRSTTKIG